MLSLIHSFIHLSSLGEVLDMRSAIFTKGNYINILKQGHNAQKEYKGDEMFII